MAFDIAHVIFASAEVSLLRRPGNVSACSQRPFEVCVEMVYVYAESLRSSAGRLRTGHAIVRPN